MYTQKTLQTAIDYNCFTFYRASFYSRAVLFRKSDFTDPFVQKKMINATGGKRFDVVLSDMAPNASGCHSLDSQSIVRLALLAMRFALVNSRSGLRVHVGLFTAYLGFGD